MATFSPSCRLVELAHFLVLVSLLRQEMRNPQWPGSLGQNQQWKGGEQSLRGEKISNRPGRKGKLASQPFPCSSWSPALVTLVPMSALALTLCPAMVAPGGVILLCLLLPSLNLRILFLVVERGLLSPWKEKSSVETSVSGYLVC